MRKKVLFGCVIVLFLIYFYPIFILDYGIVHSRYFIDYSDMLKRLTMESGSNILVDSVLGFLMSLITAGSFVLISKSGKKGFPYVIVLIGIVLVMLVIQIASYEVVKTKIDFVTEQYNKSGYESLISWSTQRINETFIILGLLLGIKTSDKIAGTPS